MAMVRETKKLTAYGKAVRKHRIEAGVKLADHARYLGKSISLLSGIEFGDKTITDEILNGTIEFFESFGVGASDLIEKAKYSAQQYEIDWYDFSEPDKQLVDCFASRLPEMTEERKKGLWDYLNEV